jgi:hypothetical protein
MLWQTIAHKGSHSLLKERTLRSLGQAVLLYLKWDLQTNYLQDHFGFLREDFQLGYLLVVD